jgi:lipoyl(octanoyl) transferase
MLILKLLIYFVLLTDIKYIQCNKLRLFDLSSYEIPYAIAWNFQKKLLHYHIELQKEKVSSIAGSLLILQHPPVFTFGSGSEENSIPFRLPLLGSEDHLQYDTLHVERGGQATYHGPGQIVIYPILDLSYFEKDIDLYLRNLEQVVIDTCSDYGLSASRIKGLTGVWIQDKYKVASLGIKLRRWVTMHGLSINVNPDLRYNSYYY